MPTTTVVNCACCEPPVCAGNPCDPLPRTIHATLTGGLLAGTYPLTWSTVQGGWYYAPSPADGIPVGGDQTTATGMPSSGYWLFMWAICTPDGLLLRIEVYEPNDELHDRTIDGVLYGSIPFNAGFASGVNEWLLNFGDGIVLPWEDVTCPFSADFSADPSLPLVATWADPNPGAPPGFDPPDVYRNLCNLADATLPFWTFPPCTLATGATVTL
jgi:hypothetical protein